MKLSTAIARFETKNCHTRNELWVELGRQQLSIAGGGGGAAAAAAAMCPQSTRLTAGGGGSGAAAASQQGFIRVEHSTRAQTGGVPLCGILLDENIKAVQVLT